LPKSPKDWGSPKALSPTFTRGSKKIFSRERVSSDPSKNARF